MRSYAMNKLNMRYMVPALTALLIILLAAFAYPQAYAAGGSSEVKVPYTHIYDADGNRTDDSFSYQIKAVGGAPAPEGSSDGIYYFTIKGVPGAEPVTGTVSLKIPFSAAGEYSYDVSAYVPEKQEGFTYEERSYRLNVYVRSDGKGGFKDPMVTAVGPDGKKYERLQFNPGHASETLAPGEVRPTTTPTGDGAVPEEGVTTGTRTTPKKAKTPAATGDQVTADAPALRNAPGGGNAVNGGNPAVAAPAPADEGEEIADNRTPLSNLINKVLPDASREEGRWAILNLILAILSLIIGGVLLKQYFERTDTEEDEYIVRRGGGIRLLGIIPAVLSAVLFIATEDLSGKPCLADSWTPLMLAVFAFSVLTAVVSYKVYGSPYGHESDI